MSDTLAGALQALTLLVILAALYRPLGEYIAWVFTSTRHLRVERGLYRLLGVAPDASQSARSYTRAVLWFSAVGFLMLYALQRLQAVLPASLGLPAVEPGLAFSAAASFVTNTNWQAAAPETTVGFAVQMAGLGVQNFLSATVGLAVAVALIRGFSLRGSATIGNFWVDLGRGLVRLLVPLSVIAALVLIAGGVVQNLTGFTDVTSLTGQSVAVPGGPVASQTAIAHLGTNGGGFFNANAAHPLANPQAWTNLFLIVLMLAIPFSLPRAFGRMIGDHRQGWAILAVMTTFFLGSLITLSLLESSAGTLEGKEERFGMFGTTLFSSASTLTSTGAVNSAHDSFSPLGGMIPLLNMMLGEVAPGGIGTGLYGMLVLAVIAVFVAGLLVGRTPEYLGKKIGPTQIKLASLYILVSPVLVLAGTALSVTLARTETAAAILNPGHHGLTEVLYAFTSAANNNGSAFGGLTSSGPWFSVAMGVVMLLGRFVPIVIVLALAGSLAAQDRVPVTAGTLPTHRPLFVGLLIAVTVIVTALTYFPALALGPLAEGL